MNFGISTGANPGVGVGVQAWEDLGFFLSLGLGLAVGGQRFGVGVGG